MQLAADHAEGAAARAITRVSFERDHVRPDAVNDAALVMSELFSNAVRASNEAATVAVEVTLGGDQVELALANCGDAFQPPLPRS